MHPIFRLLIASHVLLAACSSERAQPPASERARDATPFFCNDESEVCFAWPQSCIFTTIFSRERGAECVEVPRVWCFRLKDAQPGPPGSPRSIDPTWDCWSSEKRCLEYLHLEAPGERCFMLDDSRILERHQ